MPTWLPYLLGILGGTAFTIMVGALDLAGLSAYLLMLGFVAVTVGVGLPVGVWLGTRGGR